MTQSSNLKDKIDVTQKEINNILPENVSILNNMQNFNIEVYTKTIKNLRG